MEQYRGMTDAELLRRLRRGREGGGRYGVSMGCIWGQWGAEGPVQRMWGETGGSYGVS